MPHSSALRRAALVLVLFGLSPAGAVAQQNSTNPYYDFLQARRLEAAGDTRAAIAALMRAAAADPRSAEIKAELAGLHLRSKPAARAEGEKAAKEALAIDEKNVEANSVLGYMYANDVNDVTRASSAAENVKNAILHLERAAAGTIGVDLQMQLTLGQLYLRNSEPKKAAESLARVVAQNPANPQLRQLLAGAYAASGDLKGAIATLEEIVDYSPVLARDLARYLEQDGQLVQAAGAYSLALTQSPNNRELKLLRIGALYKAKEFSEAARYAAEGRKQHPEDVNFPRVQARAMFDAGDRSGAIAVAEAAAKQFPKDAQTHWVLVDLYSDAGRTSEAEKVLRQMLSAEPSNARVMNHLGYLLATRGEQLDEAVTLVQRALQADPGRPEYLDSLGWAHYKRGELDDALKYLNAAAEKLPEHSEILDHLGDVHFRRGSLPEAIAAWTKALAGSGDGVDKAAIEKKLQDAKRKQPR